MATDPITARLAEMLGTPVEINDEAIQEATLPGHPRETVAEFDARHSAPRAKARPEACTGRGPTGRLRNFRAMNGAKLQATYEAVLAEDNDLEALEALAAEMTSRGLS